VQRGLAHSKTWRRFAPLSAVFSLALCASAQTYSIDWFKVSGGGGMSTGGVYSASGTISQADAGGTMNGGNDSLTGGLWSLVAVVQTPGTTSLTVTRSGGSVIVSWPYPSSGWTLEQNGSVASASGWQTSGYTINTNAAMNSITLSAPTGGFFFRLCHP
jgi:hypothetical protein